MKKAVKHVLQQCCAQLRSKLLKRNKNKENALRKKNLSRVRHPLLPQDSHI